jgi:hypothetical protein
MIFVFISLVTFVFFCKNGIDLFKQEVEDTFLDLQAYPPMEAIHFADYTISRIKSHYILRDFEYSATTWDKRIDEQTMTLVFSSATVMNIEKEVKLLQSDIRTREAYFYRDSGWIQRDFTHERYLFVFDPVKERTGILYVHYSVKEKGVFDEVNDLLTLTFYNVKTFISAWEYYTKKIPPYTIAGPFTVSLILLSICLLKKLVSNI